MKDDGLRIVQFGDEAGVTLSKLKAVLGEPSADTGMTATPFTGACGPDGRTIAEQSREVRWGRLTVAFTAGPSVFTQTRVDQFVLYYYDAKSGPPPSDAVTTDEGITIGTTWDVVGSKFAPVATVKDGFKSAHKEQSATGLGMTGDNLSVRYISAGAVCGGD